MCYTCLMCHTWHKYHSHVSLVIKCVIEDSLVSNFNKVRGWGAKSAFKAFGRQLCQNVARIMMQTYVLFNTCLVY
jgi:hypothetical protein